MEEARTPEYRRVKLATHHRTISPRLNQLLQLFQSKVQEQTPKKVYSKGEVESERHDSPSLEPRMQHYSHGPGYLPNVNFPSYNASLKRSVDVVDGRGITRGSNVADKSSHQTSTPHSRTPYSRSSSAKRPLLTRQKSFQKTGTNVVPLEKSAEAPLQESSAEQLKSVNYLLRGTGSFRQDSKDQGYFTDSSQKSPAEPDKLNDDYDQIGCQVLKSPEPTLDDLMREKLGLHEDPCLENHRWSPKSSQISKAHSLSSIGREPPLRCGFDSDEIRKGNGKVERCYEKALNITSSVETPSKLAYHGIGFSLKKDEGKGKVRNAKPTTDDSSREKDSSVVISTEPPKRLLKSSSLPLKEKGTFSRRLESDKIRSGKLNTVGCVQTKDSSVPVTGELQDNNNVSVSNEETGLKNFVSIEEQGRREFDSKENYSGKDFSVRYKLNIHDENEDQSEGRQDSSKERNVENIKNSPSGHVLDPKLTCSNTGFDSSLRGPTRHCIRTTAIPEDDDLPSSFRIRSFTDSSLKERRPLLRSRSVVMRPPRRLCVSESENGIQLDENGVLQIMNDIKSMKTCLLKLKRELQEAPLQSPLANLSSGSCRFFGDSFSSPNSTLSPDDSGNPVFPGGQRRLVRRTTVGSCAMKNIQREALNAQKTGESPNVVEKPGQVDENSVEKLEKLNDNSVQSSKERNEHSGQELASLKNELQQVKQECNCHLIAREELEHELVSKNYTIKLLQTQLEGQEYREEIQNLKGKVENLNELIAKQQSQIVRLTQNSPIRSDNDMKCKSYWSELRRKLKDATLQTVQTTTHYISTPETVITFKQLEED